MDERAANKKTQRPAVLPAVLPPGMKLGKYEILAHIGTGGMAIIYKARDTLLDRHVSIKQIASNYAADPKWCERFRREAQMVAQLGSVRNVVTVYELLENESGLFLIMEYVEGESLETLIKGGALPIQEALEILWAICLGLRRVHAAGIIHRDLKPGNVLVPLDRKAKIADFGVAAHRGGETSMALGTTKYMAPELFSGQQVDGRCDVYSLGFIGFEMLAGPERFGQLFRDVLRDARSASLRWMNWHARMDAKLPPLHELNPDVPRPLSKIIARMTAKKLEERFQSIQEVIEEIKKHFTAAGGSATRRLPAHAPSSRGAPAAAGTERRADEGAITPAKPMRTRILLQADAADQDESPTAELPGEPSVLARHRGLFIYGGAALGAVVAVLVVLLVLARADVFTPKRLRTAAKLAREGIGAFEGRKYAQAADQWARVLELDAAQETEAGAYAYKWLPVAQAKQKMAEHQWDDAVQLFEEAKKRGASEAKVNKYIAEADTARTVEGAKAAYRAFLGADEFELARDQIAVIEEADPENPDLPTLREEVVEAEDEHKYQGHLARAEEFLRAKKYDAARAAYRDARMVKDTAQVRELLAAVDTREEFDEEYKSAQNAMGLNDFRTAARHFANAKALIPSDDLDRKFKDAMAQALLQEARELKRQGKMTLAIAKFRESLKYAQTAEAKAEVDRDKELKKWRELVRAGREAQRRKDWKTALANYRQAEAIEKTDVLSVSINECRYHLKLDEGDLLANEEKWEEARTAYEEARGLGDPTVVDARLKELQSLRGYAQKLKEGDTLRAAGQFAEARRAYKEAQRLRKTVEVQARLDELAYIEFLTRGKQAMAAREYRAAVAWLKRAIDVKATEEAKGLLAEAERKAWEAER